MSEAAAKYNPNEKPQSGGESQNEELRLLSVNEARKILHIRYEVMKSIIEAGKIRYVNLNGTIKIPYFELKEFLQKNLIRNFELKEQDSYETKKRINNIINKYKKEYGNTLCT